MEDNFSDGDDDISKEQVLGLGNITSDESTDEENDDMDDSDEGTSDDDDLYQMKNETNRYESDEDGRLMGKEIKHYFGTDITDEMHHKKSKQNHYKKGTVVSDIVIEESVKLREKTASKIKPTYFTKMIEMGIIPNSTANGAQGVEKQLKMKELKSTSKKSGIFYDVSTSSQNGTDYEYPELEPAFDDYMALTEDLKNRLHPLIEASKKGLIPKSPASEYLETRYFLTMNFIVVISVYMLVKNSDNYHPDHDSIRRIAEYRQLLKELSKADGRFGQKLQAWLNDYNDGNLIPVAEAKPKKMLGILRKHNTTKITEKISTNYDSDDDLVAQRMKEAVTDSEDEDQEMIEPEIKEQKPNKDDETRYITYQISKNKGLMPSRKKEQRNPRVKYRNKYQDKLKRRKGQIREVRKELDRYSGEKSGIKSFLVRSRKLN